MAFMKSILSHLRYRQFTKTLQTSFREQPIIGRPRLADPENIQYPPDRLISCIHFSTDPEEAHELERR
jgi:hypothetical protein